MSLNKNCLIIPVYNNEKSLGILIENIKEINDRLSNKLEVLFIVDGSLDNCYEILKKNLSNQKFSSKIILLSRNFGALNAIRTGLEIADGNYFATMSADLQEPTDLVINFFKTLHNEPFDLVVGVRESREDPLLSKLMSNLFWYFYKKFIFKEIPKGGVDVFGCNKVFKDSLLQLKESNSSLITQLFWIGFRRTEIKYKRKKREFGSSQWTMRKKLKYMTDSVFSFSDLPIKLLTIIGALGIFFFGIVGITTMISKFMGLIDVPGYASIVLSIGLIGAINIFSLGLIGSYAWRTYENTKARPLSIILKIDEFN